MWAKKYDKCIVCGTTEKKHAAKGLCVHCYAKNQQEKYPEKIKKITERYYRKNSEKCRERSRTYRKANPEKIKEYTKRYKEENPEYSKKYCKENSEKLNRKNREYYKKNSKKVIERCKRYREENSEKCKEREKKYRKNNYKRIREKEKKYRIENVEKCRESARKYKKGNRKKCNECNRIYVKKRMENDPRYKLRRRISSLIAHRLRYRLSSKKGKSIIDFLPYTIDELMQHLENLFTVGMTWDNYGYWHIDHKIPDSLFNYKNVEDREFQDCWALKNLQPLWWYENLEKSNKVI